MEAQVSAYVVHGRSGVWADCHGGVCVFVDADGGEYLGEAAGGAAGSHSSGRLELIFDSCI